MLTPVSPTAVVATARRCTSPISKLHSRDLHSAGGVVPETVSAAEGAEEELEL